jgi:hypothetical protein
LSGVEQSCGAKETPCGCCLPGPPGLDEGHL